MRRIALLTAAAAFILNPGLACSPAEGDGYEYGAEEMKAMVEGDWTVVVRSGDGSESTVAIRISQAEGEASAQAPRGAPGKRGLIRSAVACGSRTLVKTASACMDESAMPVDVAYLSGDQRFQSAVMSGKLTIRSKRLVDGYLSLTMDGLHFNVRVAVHGGATVDTSSNPDGSVLLSVERTSG